MKHTFVDLHIHSTASDGTCTPSQIIRLARRERVEVCALTDHDTLDGLAEAEAEALSQGVVFIRGCEISTKCSYGNVHILGLWLPADKQKIAPLEQALKEEREKREQRNLLMTEKLRELGIDIKYEEVTRIAGNAVVGRPHFAQLLKEKRVISQEKEAFYRYIGKDCPAYVERRQILPEQGVEILKKSGAVIAFAHPGQLKDCSPEEFEKLVARLKECGLDALEVYHSSHTAANVRYLKETAKKYGLAVTGGSDFHGAHKPNIRLGHVLSGSIKENRIGYDIYARLNEYRLQR